MYQTTQEQKDKYLKKMRSIREGLSPIIPKITEILANYGTVFYKKTKGQYTEAYWREAYKKAEEDIQLTIRDQFTEVIDALSEEKEKYMNECFEDKETTDPIELNFVSKELELMDRAELQEFFELHFLDKNMVRLFDIELKRRSKSGNTLLLSEAMFLQSYKNEFQVNDIVIQKYITSIKDLIAARSVSSDSIFVLVFDDNDKMTGKLISIREMFNYIHAKSAWGAPSKDSIDIMELAK